MTKFFLLGLFGLQSAVMTAQAQVFDNLPITEAENSFALRGGARTAEGEPTASNWQSFHPNWTPLSDLVGRMGEIPAAFYNKCRALRHLEIAQT